MPTVAVNPELIRWAIDRSGVPVDELRDKFMKIDDWLSGERQPTFRQLEHDACLRFGNMGNPVSCAVFQNGGRRHFPHLSRNW